MKKNTIPSGSSGEKKKNFFHRFPILSYLLCLLLALAVWLTVVNVEKIQSEPAPAENAAVTEQTGV